MAAHADDIENEAWRTGLCLAGYFPDSARLAKVLEALQFAGWIGLYRGEEDWYYRVRSDQSESSTRS